MSASAAWFEFDAELKRQISRAWPEIYGTTHPIFRVSQMERQAWRHLMDFYKLEAPWVVWRTPPVSTEPGWGACNVVYRPLVTVFYIAALGVDGTRDIASYLQEKLTTLEDTLMLQDYDGFQYWPGETIIDVSENNPVNMIFLGSNVPLQAGSLTFRCLFGYNAARARKARA